MVERVSGDTVQDQADDSGEEKYPVQGKTVSGVELPLSAPVDESQIKDDDKASKL